jgi:hypothetical protein
MLLVERGEPALAPGSIAGPGRNRFRESHPILAPAARACLGDKPVFGHWKLPWRQLKDLPPLLFPKLACTLMEHASTGPALQGFMKQDPVRFSHQFERRAPMTRLAPRLTRRRLPQRAPLFDQIITRWLAAVQGCFPMAHIEVSIKIDDVYD